MKTTAKPSRPLNREEQDAALMQHSRRIPRRALLLSLVTLAVPVSGAIYSPETARYKAKRKSRLSA